ncbi:MAG TPA: methyltransferase domain-containing protein [Pyrinomonadaceae bacterium]|nr:methyltransferase domain-containing protein [Pyrinomonadaceae bacterium]
MPDPEKLAKIPRGNTVPGVNRAIIELLLTRGDDLTDAAVLDVPCGDGSFLDALKDFFPNIETCGADLATQREHSAHRFFTLDARHPFAIETEKNFRLITSISGVTEFDNTQQFFEQLESYLDADGVLIVSNDNIFSVRNRVLFLLFGRFRQTHLFMKPDEPTWKIIPLQNLTRILYEAGFEVEETRYVPAKISEWLWLPVAAIVYVFQYLYLRFGETGTAFPGKAVMYPFASLIARHYFLVCRKLRQDD